MPVALGATAALPQRFGTNRGEPSYPRRDFWCFFRCLRSPGSGLGILHLLCRGHPHQLRHLFFYRCVWAVSLHGPGATTNAHCWPPGDRTVCGSRRRPGVELAEHSRADGRAWGGTDTARARSLAF